ncbi:unnamed protein product [Nippostrongylus brasiliensis]|uniref:PiggyBac transposable element-derived protein 4 (inferred by orthology to a human protein) n=1 Tax=Nippostrongylus brasiliensis TaxID=27835 RepID=A0A0N4XD96_NIPBR|nr:unnamed protein product [Nippostrongylus brasiliensis]
MNSSVNLEDYFGRLLVDSDVELPDSPFDDDDDNDDVIPHGGITSTIETEDSSDEDDEGNDGDADSWSTSVEVRNQLPFTDDHCGWHDDAMAASSASECYSLFVDTILDHVVVETNRYGRQKNQVWKEVDEAEFKVFVALCLRMGYVKLPELRNYWCTSGDFGDTPICAKYMSRFRFEEILSHIHLNDNSRNTHDDRLFKARPVIEIFNSICGKLFRPSRKICIDESIVPFRGRIIFRQYIPNKRHRYGIKVFKLCAEGGYTWRIQVYAGKDPTRQGPVAQSAAQ